MESREFTEDEIYNNLSEHLSMAGSYWANLDGKTDKEKVAGIIFSMLVMLDGGTDMPAFIVAPCPHEDDKEYCKDMGENYYPDNTNADVKCDLGGGLHELVKIEIV